MSNILSFQSAMQLNQDARLRALITAVVEGRHGSSDIYWLKEVAELLGVLASEGEELPPGALDPLHDFYDRIEDQLHFFPQYYRFLLSICLDLEDLGMAGQRGQELCNWVATHKFAEAEMSDLQRAEARRLLRRRGVGAPVEDGPLARRLHRFMSRPATFALPNKKAAYELTHVVFYLSDYGRRVPVMSHNALLGLHYAGILAHLDLDFDLLAEVCAALVLAKAHVPPVWQRAVADSYHSITLFADRAAPLGDGYHQFLVSRWALGLMGARPDVPQIPAGPLRFSLPDRSIGPLHGMSESLHDMGPARQADWPRMRGHILTYLSPECQAVLAEAEGATPYFETFFECFSRAAFAEGQISKLARSAR
ncbi:hypothetical protein JQV27_05565 [Sulfitobacter mediterraneus]|uniref:DUF6902 family protein n=1 Tax=Sulfitobacter mediterraneus TaxID=83219 RepID=UPI0019347827|nr:hypothetical protein [Sulfitobacter mediterraneus]MBM1632289.1 hypothetical protein [Sulfitobacter mediterraneus]MBM1640105.1 hypothetical protein [Sulfitobacter mediterraneus]MBM1644154.1 hypothetical protein [Sulfitobacter mediterraneus]MBM1648200.1 hypothetical protein [Sulfitobacter mediterraneus]MBM1652245.1 hypothetical protein [Sulfitobacter mediterraneus]